MKCPVSLIVTKGHQDSYLTDSATLKTKLVVGHSHPASIQN